MRALFSACLVSFFATLAWPQANYTAPYVFGPLAGTSSTGGVDGVGQAARLYRPQGVAADAAGNVFVADSDNHTIRKISAASVVTTVAGSPGKAGGTDGIGAAARFDFPSSLALDAGGNLYVADANNHAIRKIAPDGTVSTVAGTAGVSGSTDGAQTSARFHRPEGIAVDPAGNLFVADTGNHVIRKITPAGAVTTLAGSPDASGWVDGAGATARFSLPYRIASDASGNLYVTDANNWGIRKITPAGAVTTIFSRAGNPGGSSPPVSVPTGIAVTTSGRIYFADRVTNAIYEVNPAGDASLVAGGENLSGIADGLGTVARFNWPAGLATDAAGNLFVADRDNNTVRKVTPLGMVTTLAGLGHAGAIGSADGVGAGARFGESLAVAAGADGDVYVADAFNHTIRKITSTGSVITFAGSAAAGRGSVDGQGGFARFSSPLGVAVDPSGTVYVADTFNHLVRRITSLGAVTTLAGEAGVAGTTDGIGRAARFFEPAGIAVGAGGAVYVAEPFSFTIRRITADGSVTTFAGSAGNRGSADGSSTAARFNYPWGIAADVAGNLYVADTLNHTVRKITPAGTVTTLAGAAGSSGNVDGTGAEARLAYPEGITVDSAGNVFVTQRLNQVVRKITPLGAVTTVAGLAGRPGYLDGLGADVRFLDPSGIAADTTGNLYVADGPTVRKGRPAGAPVFTLQPQNLSVSSGSQVQFSATATGMPVPTYQWFFNGAPFVGATQATLSFSTARSSDAGEYHVVATNSLGSVASNRATLTVTGTPGPGPGSPPSPPTGSGGGGGGAISTWAMLALFVTAALRFIRGQSGRKP